QSQSQLASLPPGEGLALGSGESASPFVGIRWRQVGRHAMVRIIAWVSPCEGNSGRRVRLLRGNRRNGSRLLGPTCTARFHPRVRRRAVFRAELVPEEDRFLFAESRLLTIKIDHRRR
ncbi:MAG: hypothetical protein WAM94_08345, partial [Chromatiaceae bacterium]